MLETFKKTRKQSVALCKAMKIEEFGTPLSEEIHSPKWYLGHTTWYYEKHLLTVYLEAYQPYNKLYDEIFKEHISTVLAVHSDVSKKNRTSLKCILQYRKYVELHMITLILERENDAHFCEILNEAIHYERKQQEYITLYRSNK